MSSMHRHLVIADYHTIVGLASHPASWVELPITGRLLLASNSRGGPAANPVPISGARYRVDGERVHFDLDVVKFVKTEGLHPMVVEGLVVALGRIDVSVLALLGPVEVPRSFAFEFPKPFITLTPVAEGIRRPPPIKKHQALAYDGDAKFLSALGIKMP